jgi:hypothetical protein
MTTVYDGQTALGFIIKRRDEYEAYDREEKSLGMFPSMKAAADAISEAGETVRPRKLMKEINEA